MSHVTKSYPSAPLLFLFGAPRIERNGKPVAIDTRKAFALIAYLAVTRQSHSRDALATLLWSEYDQTRARGALRRTLSVLNAALADGQLEIDREAIALAPAAKLYVDVDEFHRRLADTVKHGHAANEICARCITPLSEAAALYRDDFMAGFTLRDSPAFDEWQFFQSESLRRELAGTLEKLVRHHSAQCEYEIATVHARRWLALDPLHEPAHRDLMQLYAATGQRAAALRQYQECVRVLQQELSVQPLEETTLLYESIRSGAVEQGSRGASEQTTPQPPNSAASQPFPLVGRAAEWDALLKAYNGITVNGQFIVLQGEAGVGKTRLAEALLEHARGKGIVTISARCYEGETNLAYDPFIEALRAAVNSSERAEWLRQIPVHFIAEAARLLPELQTLRKGLPQSVPLDNPGAQARFFEGISQVLLAIFRGRLPGILLIDDLQWIDPASLDLLTYVVQRLRGKPLCILGTWRGDARPASGKLRQLLAESQRAGLATVLNLARLNVSAVAELIDSIPDLPRGLSERLYRETEGLPFFIVEYLAAIRREHHAPNEAWTLPGSVREMLHARLLDVTETGSQLLSAAAVIGRSFDFETLRAASGRSEEETVSALEILIAQGLVKDVNTDEHGLTYDFNHEKLRALVYEETSHARRRLLHRRVAESIETQARLHHLTGALAGQIAYHFRQAGADAQAAEYFKLAGDHARSLYANADAMAHFRAALDLHHPDPAALHVAIGDLQTLKGDYGAALEAYTAAANLLAPKTIASLEHKLGLLHHRRGEWDLAEKRFQAALHAISEDAISERARLFADWSLTAHRQGHIDQAESRAHRALELAERANDTHALAQAHNILGILASSRGDQTQAREHLEQSVALAAQLGDPGIRTAALNNLALNCRAAGETARAIELTQTALDLCASLGDRHRQAALHNNLADLLHDAGQSDAAMAHLKQAVAIFAEIGEAGAWQPEIWKLVEW